MSKFQLIKSKKYYIISNKSLQNTHMYILPEFGPHMSVAALNGLRFG